MYDIEYYFDKNGYSDISDKALANMNDWLERNNL